MTIAPYGTWQSPVTAELTAGSSNAVIGLQTDGDDLYWWEARPLEGGRYVLMKYNGEGAATQITPDGFNVRTRVHEYGGTSYLVVDGTVYFSNFADQKLYQQVGESDPQALSLTDGMRYADCDFDVTRQRLLCVREDHTSEGEAVNSIVAVPVDAPNDGQVLWQESDFVGYPRISKDGATLAWTSWDHPNMPWDNLALWVADVDADGNLQNPRRVNEGIDESVLQPTWAEDGSLYCLTDRSGWWNMHRLTDQGLQPVHSIDAELGGPLWALGLDFFQLIGTDRALIEYGNADGGGIGVLDLNTGLITDIEAEYVGFGSLQVQGETAYFLGSQAAGLTEVVSLNLTDLTQNVLHTTGEQVVADGYLSMAESITFPTAGGEVAYGYYYPPKNQDFQAPDGELPPLMVLMHGGPTGATSPAFSVAKQYWTSRGFAIVDVNYRGSTGYGRAYRQKLNGQWGIVDLEDAVAATEYLVAEGKADPNRLLIRGGSAGGYTTLSALAFTEVFAAGANYFGVSDLMALAEHTHKFESRYLDSMIGPYPEAAEVYEARSPINSLDGFNSPLITFQGLEDKVVPPAQSEMIYEAVKAKGTPTAYVAFEGEQHGFRKAENNIKALQSELYFYGQVLGFEPYGDLPEVEIDNMPVDQAGADQAALPQSGSAVADELKIHYQVQGSGPAMVLLHGWGADSQSNWVDSGWVAALTPHRTVVSIDSRGHGLSDKPYDSSLYSYDVMTADVIAVMDQLGVEQADLLGYSMGAFIGASLLKQHPDRFSSMVLGGIGDETEESAAQGAFIAAALRAESLPDDHPGQGVRQFVQASGNNDLLALAHSAEQMWPEGYPRDLIGPNASEIDVPVLIVNGADDQPYVETADALADALGNARHVRIPDRDHLTVVADERFKDSVLEFLIQD